MPKNTSLYAVILAGGSGTRFWPVSRKTNPKQFLDITGDGTLLEKTLGRIKTKIPGARTLIVTNTAYARAVRSQAARFRVPGANILLEPAGKNTAPAICWAAAEIQKVDPGAVMAVLPSDHLILNRQKFLRVLDRAVTLAGQDYLVTLGIPPTRPDTGYGYLKTAGTKRNGQRVLKVEKFTEKPSLAKAKQFLRSKNYLWNSGMFIWKTDVILEAFAAHAPSIHRQLGAKTGTAHIRRAWPKLPSISVDYAILEKAKKVAAVPASGIGWSDLGSWESLMDVLAKDRNGNILKGDVAAVDCRHALIWGSKKLIAAIGLDGVVVIDTPDALLVCPKERAQDVRRVVDHLTKTKRREV